MQVLFANLQESLKKYYDTMPFCATIKDSEGRPINVGQQMDCNEFSNTLFDKLESSLKGKKFVFLAHLEAVHKKNYFRAFLEVLIQIN